MQKIRDTAGQYSHDAGEVTARGIIFLALAASLLWHIFLLFSVKVFVGPSAIPVGRYSQISFVGAILEEKPMIADSGAGVKSIDFGIDRMLMLSETVGGEAERVVPVSEIDALKEMSAAGEVTGEKQIPEKPFDMIVVNYKTYPSEIEGPARFREIVYRPELPPYLRWDESLGVDPEILGDSFDIELKFWVSAEGKVESVERVSSSGHPTVDIVGIRYLKGWQFAPLKSGAKSEGQWGTVKLKLKLEKAGGG